MARKWQFTVLCLAIALGACSPENTVSKGFLQYEPAPGYVWKNPDGFSWDVVWKPGAAHPDYPHIAASSDVGNWQPNFGYEWSDGSGLSVRWKPGARYADLPHMKASATEGQWQADPGYLFAEKGVLKAAWAPGARLADFPNITAGNDEGSWIPDPGYYIPPPPTDKFSLLSIGRPSKFIGLFNGGVAEPAPPPTVVWGANLTHPQFPHISSDVVENRWRADPGYRFIRANDLTVEPIPNGETSGDSERFNKFIAGLGKAIIGGYFSEDQPDDGLFASAVGRPAARAMRDKGYDDMVEAVTK